MIVENKDGYAIVKFDRPEKLNALNLKTRNDMISILRKLNADPTVKSVILTGEGRGFCVGADLSEMVEDIYSDLKYTFQPIINEIRNPNKLYISAINGVVAGACLGIVLSTDFRISKKDVKFVTAFQRIGLTSDTGVAYFLAKLLGVKSYDLLILGGEFTAEDAEKWGLVKISEDPLSEAVKLAQRISAGPFLTYVAGKKMVNKILFEDMDDFLEYEALLQSELGKTEDFKEGVQSFIEKREPKYKGR
ncbi:enoyl-CoA hydratase [Sulfolobus acidocaldarius SUSAZ]|nr:enoyl-CoA hydratase [Sulfolobus acidocaldarius SUSAZ]